jgi:PAS domain S-box-containing protein
MSGDHSAGELEATFLFAREALGHEALADFFQRVIDAIADPLFVKDEQHRWIVVNRAFCEFMGRPREALLGKSDFDFLPTEEAEMFWKKDAEVLASAEVNTNEERLTDSDGVVHTIVTKKSAFTDRTGRRVIVGIIRDVTANKEAEEALRRARHELEERVAERTREVEEAQSYLRQARKMEAVGQLTGGVAHDFNNLLAVVMGNLEVLRKRCEGDILTLRSVEQAIEATKRGATLTQRLLAFSRKQALAPQPTELNELVEGTIPLIRRSVRESVAIEWRRSLLPVGVLIDRGQLETALLNLCVNARDAMSDSGKLVLEVSTVDVADGSELTYGGEAVVPGRYARVAVSDTGVGMDSETLERVFDPFFTTKPSGKGSGLGLSMVYGFVKQSKGYVSIASESGRGTTVSILLPELGEARLVADAPQAPTTEESEPRGRGESILVVEDEPNVRKLAVMLCESLGYEVHEAGSAPEALALLPELSSLRLLLTDIVLAGGMRGDELAREVVGIRPEVRVLFMSGYTESGIGEPWASGGYRLLQKPFRFAELARFLREALA